MMIGGKDVLKLLEVTIPDMLEEEQKTEEFTEHYERMLNRVRWLVERDTPMKPFFIKAKSRSYHDWYECGRCRHLLKYESDKHCPKCGQMADWRGWPSRSEFPVPHDEKE